MRRSGFLSETPHKTARSFFGRGGARAARSRYSLFLPLFCVLGFFFAALEISPATAQDKSAEELYEAGELEAVRTRPADSGEDKEHGFIRQGYGHVRQGNTSSADDPLGRAQNGRKYAPYGAENYDELRGKFESRLQNPSWQLDLDLHEPRRIVINRPDGTAEEYWYILFRVTNRNMRKVTRTTVANYNPGKTDSATPQWVEVNHTVSAAYEGIPVQTVLDVVVETLDIDALAEPARSGIEQPDDLRRALEQEALRDVGAGLSERTRDADAARALRLAEQRYVIARRAYADIGDPFVVRAIAERERLWEWRDGKREYILWPASAFKRDLSPSHQFLSDWLTGPRCLPRETAQHEDAGRRTNIVTRYPAVFEDGAFAGYFGEGDPLPSRSRLVRDQADELYGKLTLRRYRPGDTVDRFGRILTERDPGYLDARAGGGEVIVADEAHGIEGQLEHMIDTVAKRPPYRIYKKGDRVLVGWDTGVPRPDDPNANHIINGLIVTPNDQRANRAYVKERGVTVRGATADELLNGAETLTSPLGRAAAREVGMDFIRAARENRYETAAVLDEGTDLFGRRPVGDNIPVKVIDHLGRPVRRQIVTYEPGERVTEDEYRVWAQRYPKDVVAKFDTTPWTRPLKARDFLVGLPKIKMGRLLDVSMDNPEVLRRGVAELDRDGNIVTMRVVDYRTGRRYDPKSIRPDVFMRDPDGSFFTERAPPVPAAARLQPGEEYVYAPLGPANDGAVPVPAFDRLGVWRDYLDPMTGARIPLRDQSGELVRDEMDQIQYVKEFEYEWLYEYEFAPELIADRGNVAAADKGFLAKYGEDRQELETVNVDIVENSNGGFEGLAMYRVYQLVRVVNPFTGAPETEKRVQRLTFDANDYDASANENIEAPDEYLAPGRRIKQVAMSRYMFEHLKDAVAGRGGKKAMSDDFFDEPAAGDIHNNALENVVRTYDRWTLPPPLVMVDENGRPVAQTRVTQRIGPATRADGSDAARAHVHYISERWGAFVFTGIDRSWDYLNVYVRGLRPPAIRKGRVAEQYQLPGASDPNTATVQKVRFDTRWRRQDWVHMSRFERLGDEFENYRDLIRRVRDIWYLRGESDPD